ncbi:MAG TPA: hypothetical protein VFG45_04245 [Candidatus Nitrosocosmicus sp.]|nr:hypothetical protein [Candidatus Nitrosocosmicus sp.]
MQYSDEYGKFITRSIDECFILLDNPSYENYKKLRHELDQIISYSKLEDHSNIQIITDKITYIVDSLVAGHLSSSIILDILTRSLKKIKDDISFQNHVLDLDLIEEIKMNYNIMKADEKDFIYTKNLKVLLISADEFLSNLILKNVDTSIDLTVIQNYNKAFDIMQTTIFDIVVCDILEDSTLTEDFIMGYSKTIPIAIFYRAGYLHLVLKAAKLGIKKIISLDEMAVKYLVKTLHRIYADWTKEKKKILLRPVLENPNTRVVLSDMLLTELPIFQRVRSFFTNEIDMNHAIKESYDLKVNELIKSNSDMIDSLVKERFLIKQKVKNVLVCPNCDSIDLDLNYQCISCDNLLFTKYNEVFIHRSCNYAGLKHVFAVGNNFYCPGCNKKISILDDCIKEPSYHCQKCSAFFTTPFINYRCNFCDYGPFTYIQGKLKTVYRYDINPLFEMEFKRNFFILQRLSDYLNQSGYDVSYNEKSSKNVTTETFFDLVAKKADQTMIFVILTSHLEYNIELLYHIETLHSGSENIIPIVISLNEPDQLIINLLLKFDIFLIVSDNDKEILAKTKEYLTTI